MTKHNWKNSKLVIFKLLLFFLMKQIIEEQRRLTVRKSASSVGRIKKNSLNI